MYPSHTGGGGIEIRPPPKKLRYLDDDDDVDIGLGAAGEAALYFDWAECSPGYRYHLQGHAEREVDILIRVQLED